MKIKYQVVLTLLTCLAVLLVSGCAGGGGTSLKTQVIEDIAPQEAYALIQQNQDNPDFVILDVRTPEEYAGGHIARAVNLDYYAQTFQDELGKLDREKTYLVYCRTAHRSGIAVEIMAKLGFGEVYNLEGGIVAWVAAGLPTVK